MSGGEIGILIVVSTLFYSVVEMIWLVFVRKPDGKTRVSFRHDYSQPSKDLLFVLGSGALMNALGTAGFATIGRELAPFSFSNDWYIWPVALLIYEFWYWVQHYAAHKVRMLWCIHSPHHASDTINMVVGYNHHMLEVPYMAFVLGFMPALCGVPLEMIILINAFDLVWGGMLHTSPQIFRKRYGPLEYFMQTPSYHRVHHGRNPRYMDTNYNSITLFWDWAMGTLQPLQIEEPVIYGITRDVNVES